MMIETHPSGAPYSYVGDGVYAEWDGYQVWLRVDHILAPRVVALEPKVMEILKRFSDTMIRRTGIEVAKKLGFAALVNQKPFEAKMIFMSEMTKVPTLHDGDRIELATWNFDITELAPPLEDQLTAWMNSFE